MEWIIYSQGKEVGIEDWSWHVFYIVVWYWMENCVAVGGTVKEGVIAAVSCQLVECVVWSKLDLITWLKWLLS